MNKFFGENIQKIKNFSQLRDVGGRKSIYKSDSLELSNISDHKIISTVRSLTILDCENIKRAIQHFNSIDIQHELKNDQVLLLRIHIMAGFDAIATTDLEILNEKCLNKSIVVLLKGENPEENQNNFLVYWKSRDHDKLLTLTSFYQKIADNNENVFEFIIEFLSESLSKGEIGLYREWQQYSNGHEVGAHLLADSRDYNLLLIAAETGNAEIVQILLNCGANTVADDGVGAQDLAWNNRHSEVLLVLAQANLPYPDGIDINQLSDDFKTFYKNTQELHAAIIDKSEEKVKEILNCDKNLEFYFDLSNKSAARIAVDAKAFNIYEILVIHEIFLAPHEYQQGIFDELESNDQKLIRELHNKHSKDLPDKHINVLMAHSFISHDVPDAQGKLKYVYEAYKHLSQDSRLSTILKVVAASKHARIIYDFNRDAVNIADPTTSGNTEGVFYPMGRIYIGARQLLDENTRSQAIGTLAHELCHYAVNLTYCNKAQPYKRNDNQTLQEFEKINEKCQKEKGKEEVVDLVHECYPVDMHHAELIVRPAHLIALYMNQPEKLAQLGQTFPDLFEFFNRIIKEMEQNMKAIEEREKVENERKDNKISKLKRTLKYTAIFAIFMTVSLIAISINPNILHDIKKQLQKYLYPKLFSMYDHLSETNKLKVTNAPIIYKNIEVRFHDLFPDNSTAYYKLSSDHISQMLDEQALNFSDPHLSYLNDLVKHDWENLAGKLKQKFLTSNFTFQNESLKFEKLGGINSEVFNSLSSEQIVDVLDGKKLVVGKMIKDKIDYYIERKFKLDDVKLMGARDRTEDGDGDDVMGSKIVSEDEDNNNGKRVKRNQNELKKATENDEDVNTHEKTDDTKIKDPEVQNSKSSDDIIKKAINDLIIILNSEIGAGKTVIFKVFTMRIKEKYPNRWVSYIDLEKLSEILNFYEPLKMFDDVPEIFSKKSPSENNSHKLASISDDLEDLSKKLAIDSDLFSRYSENLLNASKSLSEISENLKLNRQQCNRYSKTSSFSYDNIEINQTIKDLIEFIEKLIGLNLENKFEKEIFEYYFKSGNVIILWDNDRISSENRRMMTNVFNLIFKLTKNVQFISSLPLFINQLKQSLNAKIYHPVPFTESEQKDYFRSFFKLKNLPKEKVENFTQGAFNISKTLQLDSPLMQRFIAEIYESDKLYENPNFYNLILNFVDKKIEVWIKTSEAAKKLANYLFTGSNRNFDMVKMYQRIAFEKELDLKLGSNMTRPEYKHFNDLQVLKIKIPKYLTVEEIARMEILSFKSETDFKFRHRTIADFFFATYFMHNLYFLNFNLNKTETNLDVNIFKYILTNYDGSKMVKTLIEHYKVDHDYKNENFDETLNGK